MGGLFDTSAPEIKTEETAAMPAEDSEAIELAKKKKAAKVQARSGRASTIMSESDKLGG